MRLGILVFCLLCTSVVQAQVYDFGDIPIEQLEMEVYEKDSTASAVVLFDKGEGEVIYRNNDFIVIFKRHIRFKILKDEGLKLADISIPYRTRYPDQKIRKINAESYYLNSEGKVIKESVGRRDRSTEKISDNFSEIKFAVPNVRKGSIIEYSYEVESEDPFDFTSWGFQREYPVSWSEYRMKIPDFFQFHKVVRGYHPFHIEEQNRYSEKLSIRNRYGSTGLGYAGFDYRYVMKDIPALEAEPYMKSEKDYKSLVSFYLTYVKMPGRNKPVVIDSWTEVIDALLESDNFGEKLDGESGLENIIEQKKIDTLSNEEKISRIYQIVRDTLLWDKTYRLYVRESIKSIVEKGKGNGTEINFTLIKLLREAGIEAHPLLISTRDHGEVVIRFANSQQFNHTLVYARLDSSYYLLDAVNKNLAFNSLSPDVINGIGLLAKEVGTIWLPVPNSSKNSMLKTVNIDISEGFYSGTLSAQYMGLLAHEAREVLDEDDFLNSMSRVVFTDNTVKVDSAEITHDKIGSSFKFDGEFEGILQSSGDIIYFNPMITEQITDNPFQSDERKIPVDYPFPFDRNLIMNISIPDGWVVEEIPHPVLYRLPQRAGEFRRIVQAQENTIAINFRLQINKFRFMPEEYEILKGMYDQMVEVLAQNIVLKKES